MSSYKVLKVKLYSMWATTAAAYELIRLSHYLMLTLWQANLFIFTSFFFYVGSGY